MIGSVFASVHDFFHSAIWTAVELAAFAIVALFFCATVFWVFKDARRRIAEPRLVGAATLLGALPPFLGPLVYMLFRPPEYLDDVRERELEIKAIETRLGGPDLRCTVCGCHVEDDFLARPHRLTKPATSCTSCSRPLESSWQICPYCETPVAVAPPAGHATAPRAPRPTRSHTTR